MGRSVLRPYTFGARFCATDGIVVRRTAEILRCAQDDTAWGMDDLGDG
jgi:hypothetical protein